MKHKLIIKAAICCLALALASGAKASVTTPADEDLLLVFRSTGNGSGTNLEVDLGSYTNPAASLNLATDLAVYTSGSTQWYNNPNLTWAVVSTNGSTATADGLPKDTLWATSADPADTAPTASSQTSQAGPEGAINALYTGINNNGNAGTATGAFTVSSSVSNSYSGEEPTIASYFNNGLEQSGDIGSGGSDSADLWQVIPISSSFPSGKTSDVDKFTLNSSGVFTTTAVPEPSTWAMIGLGAMCLLAVRRRRLA